MMDIPVGRGFSSQAVRSVIAQQLASASSSEEAFLEEMRKEAQNLFTPAELEVGLSPQKKEAFAKLVRQRLEEFNRIALAHNLPPIQKSPELVVQEVLDAILGLGPELESLLRQKDVEDIYIIGPNEVWVAKVGGEIQKAPITFRSAEYLMEIVRRATAGTGRQISRALPYVDARLRDGSRLHAIIDPCAEPSPQVTIRRHRAQDFTPGDLIRLGTVSPEAMEFLQKCVEAKVNILIAGGTGAGKTTLLNVLCGSIPPGEMIITIEDTRELNFNHVPPPRHLVTREPGLEEDVRPILQRDLVKQTLRMRPTWLICGEVRGEEAWDLVDLGQTGHAIMGAIHAEDTLRAINRLVNYAWRAVPDFSEELVLKNVVGAIELVVVIKPFSDGTRRVVEITEIVGKVEMGGTVTRHTIFKWQDGHLAKIGRPQYRIAEKLKAVGYREEGKWTH